MATANPLQHLAPDVVAASKEIHYIAGIEVDVYGMKELDSSVKNVACLWLLNPRLCKKQDMQPIADAVVDYWKKQANTDIGIIVAAFDQRNHGTRLVSPLANGSWRDGNPRHAQDMFSIYQGTASDASQLITYLPAYVFPGDNHKIVNNMTLGISLGGHSVWHLLLHEPRITTGIVVVGCPDYINLMADRARLSKLNSWLQSSHPGSSFVGSKDFPDALVRAVSVYDPVGLFFGTGNRAWIRSQMESSTSPKSKHIELLATTLKGKKILNLAGDADTLVPYEKAKPFLAWLKNATSPNGWYRDGKVVVQDVVYKGIGHQMTVPMLQESLSFIRKSLIESSKQPVPAKI